MRLLTLHWGGRSLHGRRKEMPVAGVVSTASEKWLLPKSDGQFRGPPALSRLPMCLGAHNQVSVFRGEEGKGAELSLDKVKGQMPLRPRLSHTGRQLLVRGYTPPPLRTRTMQQILPPRTLPGEQRWRAAGKARTQPRPGWNTGLASF